MRRVCQRLTAIVRRVLRRQGEDASVIAEPVESPRDVHMYLDSTALFDFIEAMDGSWVPTPGMDEVGRRRLAAARLFFYARRPHPIDGRLRYLVVSGTGRHEISVRTSVDWTLSVLFDIDEASDAPSKAEIEAEAQRLIEAGISDRDAEHLARALLVEYIDVFVTDDKRLATRAAQVAPRRLRIMTVVEAEASLNIAPGEQPRTAPAPSSPLASSEHWWVP
jgi:hypothetical protein